MAGNEKNSSILIALFFSFVSLLFPLVYFSFAISSAPPPRPLPPHLSRPPVLFLNASLRMSRPFQSRKSQLCICPSHLIKVSSVPVKTQASFPANVFWVAQIPVNNLLPCILQIILPVWCPSCFNHRLEWMIWCTACADCYKVDWSLNQGWMHACKNRRRLCVHNVSWPLGQIVSTCYFVSCCVFLLASLRIQRIFSACCESFMNLDLRPCK